VIRERFDRIAKRVHDMDGLTWDVIPLVVLLVCGVAASVVAVVGLIVIATRAFGDAAGLALVLGALAAGSFMVLSRPGGGKS
jgi:hypothetical protein